jgi:hypothetical protein
VDYQLLRSSAAAATTVSLIASAFFTFVFSAVDPRAASASCEGAAEVAILPSPIAPWKGAPLRILVAAEKPLDGELSLIAPSGGVAAKSQDPTGRAAVFLVRRGRVAGGRNVARDVDERPNACRMRQA